MTKVYLDKNVYDAALERVDRLFSEFPNVIVNHSGGKDSTAILHLALKVAEDRKRLPLRVMFIDQEAEWQCVIDHLREMFLDDRIAPYWLQCPIRLSNATSFRERWLYCWKPGEEWLREKEPNSIHENTFGTISFKEMFDAFLGVKYPRQLSCYIAGLRCQESPGRMKGLTSFRTFKDITWGKKLTNKNHFTFYPIYDWTYHDVWKTIHDHDLSYCPLYDHMYRYGIPAHNMRVSNVHHETAIKSLWFMQEVEPATWDRLVTRLSGINTVGMMRSQFSAMPSRLPFMFKDWREYRDHLLENLVPERSIREKMRKQFLSQERIFIPELTEDIIKLSISCILVGDYHCVKIDNFHASHAGQFRNSKYVNSRRSP